MPTFVFLPNIMKDIQQIRKDFPILNRKVNGKALIYFDNAATSQKPQIVIDSISQYYQTANANVHRGNHFLSSEATQAMENSRKKIAQFFNAAATHEIIFTKGTTESINMVAHGFRQILQKNDEVLISEMEHHANIVPWQITCEMTGAKLKVIPITDEGRLDMEAFENLLNSKTKLVAITHVSNTLGSINPIKEITQKAHNAGAKVLIDGAQATAHTLVDVQELNCDFYVTSAHKMYGPTGVGILYGIEKYLDELPPYQSGGEMIKEVYFDRTTFSELPFKFEAGTPNIAGNIAFTHSIDYILSIGFEQIQEYENLLLSYANEKLNAIPDLTIYANLPDKAPVISFNIKDIHPSDLSTLIDHYGVAVRSGHHCSQPLIRRLGIPGTVRASFAIYNTPEEIDVFYESLLKVKAMLT